MLTLKPYLLLAAFALFILAASPSTQAQNNNTIYGCYDAAIDFKKNNLTGFTGLTG